jgi:ribulose-bisphosphate carboxylase large chain
LARICAQPDAVRAGQASVAAGAISLRQSYECRKAGADPIEWAKEHKEFARAFESFPKDADKLYPGWREKLGVHK